MESSVRVWLIRPELSRPRLAELAAVLDDAERRYADSLRPGPDRHRYVAYRGAVRLIVAAQLAVPPTSVHWRRGGNGKPELVGSDLRVNLSHSDDLALLAVTADRPVGVDVQRLYPHVDAVRMARRYYLAAEADDVAAAPATDRADRFAVLWTRKEACLKASGGRLMQGLRLPVQGTGELVVRDAGGPLPGPYRVRDLPVPDGFRAAVAMEGDAPFTVTTTRWPG